MTLKEKAPTEIVPLTFDFAADIATAATVTVVSVAVSVITGTDPTPANILQGAATASGATVTQWITGGVDGVRYKILCTVNASDGQRLVLAAELNVRTL